MTDLRLDPELAAVVARARHRAEAAGELHPRRRPASSRLDSEAKTIVSAWIAEGGYRAAADLVAVEDPELADQ